MSAQITHVDPEETIRKLKAKVARLEKALAAQPAVQKPQRYSPDGEGGMEVDSLGAYVKLQDVTTPPTQPAVQEPVGCQVCGGSGFIKCNALQSREKNNGKWGRCLRCQPYTTPPAQPAPVQEPVAALIDENQRLRAELKFNTLPAAQPAMPDAITDNSESPEYRTGWNDCRAEMLKGLKS